MALITTARATELVPNFPTTDTSVMTDLVNACSALIETYCNRTFAITAYDELVDGTGHSNILLNNFPVTKIDRVMWSRTSAVGIGNVKSTVSRASFRLDATNLYLESMDSGTLVQHTIARSGCATLADLATAINVYSSDGWNAHSLGVYGTFATADLYAPQGGMECRWTGLSYLWHHAFGIQQIEVNPAVGEITCPYGFQRGYQNFRVLYSAGFTTIPQDVQQACAELASALYLNRDINPNLVSENLGGYSYTTMTEKTLDNLSATSRYALSQYRNNRIPKFRVF